MKIFLNGKFPLGALVVLLLNLTASVAFADSSAMSVMGSSVEMQGTTDFYYSNEWLVKFVQFVISWLCIIALLVYYAGWLCSMVVLSNKELFYLIDTIKKEASESGGEDKGFSAVGSVLHTFKNGSKDGVNGGLDNILLFILSLSINFKAYSYYKDVEAGSGDGDGAGAGSKFSYNDTMLNFILKTAITAVTVTFVCSVAISGVLLQCWFTVSDVVVVHAERFANTNLAAKVDQWIGTTSGYNFTLATQGGHLSEVGEDTAERMYAATVGMFNGATDQQRQAIGMEIEKQVKAKMVGDSLAKGYSLADAALKSSVNPPAPIKSEDQAKLVSIKIYDSTNPESNNPGAIRFDMKSFLGGANVNTTDTSQLGNGNVYFHVVYNWDHAKAGTQTTTGRGQTNNAVPPGM